MILEEVPYAKTCASLVLGLEAKRAYWAELQYSGFRKSASGSRSLPNSSLRVQADSRFSVTCFAILNVVPHACLLRGVRLDVGIALSPAFVQQCGAHFICSEVKNSAG
jgi:hypothetical protein